MDNYTFYPNSNHIEARHRLIDKAHGLHRAGIGFTGLGVPPRAKHFNFPASHRFALFARPGECLSHTCLPLAQRGVRAALYWIELLSCPVPVGTGILYPLG